MRAALRARPAAAAEQIAFHQGLRQAFLGLNVFAIDQHQMHQSGRHAKGLDDLTDADLRRNVKLKHVGVARMYRQIICE